MKSLWEKTKKQRVDVMDETVYFYFIIVLLLCYSFIVSCVWCCGYACLE